MAIVEVVASVVTVVCLQSSFEIAGNRADDIQMTTIMTVDLNDADMKNPFLFRFGDSF